MSTKCGDVAEFMEKQAPVCLAEEWDNVGLLVGNPEHEINRIMVCLDATSNVIDEAIEKKVDLIISHHPIIFKGLKRVREDDIKGKIIYKLIKNNIDVYSAHTNLDVADNGMNEHLAKLLELNDIKNLKKYKAEKLFKIVVFVPESNLDVVRNSMCEAGAGWIGNYSNCTFVTQGEGTFKPLEGTNPYIGSKGMLEKVNECRLETIVPSNLLQKVVASMIKAHPYEEVAYDIYPLELEGKEYGMGKVGILEQPKNLEDFIKSVKKNLGVEKIKLIGTVKSTVKRVAVFCGSFDDSLLSIIKNSADVLVTGDIKYHTALDASEMGVCVIDAGHFSTERIILSRLISLLAERFPSIDIIDNTVEADPIKIT